MAIPKANTVIAINRRGRAIVEVDGIRMRGVLAVAGDHTFSGDGTVTITLPSRMVQYVHLSGSVDDAVEQVQRQLSYAAVAADRDSREIEALEAENEKLRAQLAERPRYRVPYNRGSNGEAEISR